MNVKKRSGRVEPVDLNKITKSISQVCEGTSGADIFKIATKTVGGLYDGVTTKEIDLLSIKTAIDLVLEDPVYDKIASRLMSNFIRKEVEGLEIYSFSQSVAYGYSVGLLSKEVNDLVQTHKRKLNAAINWNNDYLFTYFGLKTVYDRYLLKDPTSRMVFETPQYFLMRVACGLSDDPNKDKNVIKEVIDFYETISSLSYMPSTPTLFNSGIMNKLDAEGKARSQLASCFLGEIDDDLSMIYKSFQDCAMLSKYAGGLGMSLGKMRSAGSYIKGTNGKALGVPVFAHTLSASVAAVNQGGRRRGALAIYLPSHHPDLMDFLELKDNTGDPERRAYNLNLANWIPDLFMKRLEESMSTNKDVMWSFFDPARHPQLNILFGSEYENEYIQLEKKGEYTKQLPVRDVYTRMMRTLASTGNGWMCFKDTSNMTSNCTPPNSGRYIPNSNLCTEITIPNSSGTKTIMTQQELDKAFKEPYAKLRVLGYDPSTKLFDVSKDGETATCNLSSLVIPKYLKPGISNNIFPITDIRKIDISQIFDLPKLRKAVTQGVKFLDRVITKNFYPIPEAEVANNRLRPIGLGIMGVHELFMKLQLAMDRPEALEITARLHEEIYFTALKASCNLAQELGKAPDFDKTWTAKGLLRFDLGAKRDGYKAINDENGELIEYKNDIGDRYSNQPLNMKRWNDLKKDIIKYGLRNTLHIAIAPTASISIITGTTDGIDPISGHLIRRETLSGDFIQVNPVLVDFLKSINLWNNDARNYLKLNDGSIQGMPGISEEHQRIFRTAFEMSQKVIIDHAAARASNIDQAQSTNLFVMNAKLDTLASMYFYLWKKGLPTSYYLRSRAATKINKITVSNSIEDNSQYRKELDLESPDICESCQ